MWLRTSGGRDWRTKVWGFCRSDAHSAWGTTSNHSVQRKVTSFAAATGRTAAPPSAAPPPVPSRPASPR
eukprot:1297677-Alexandrium_andersonii.AAC.1